MNNLSTDPFRPAIYEGIQMADAYLELMEKSAQKRIEHLCQSPQSHQAIAQKFTQVFEHDTKEVMNDYAHQCYERLKYVDFSSTGEVSNSAEDEPIFQPGDRQPESLF